jgi:hypothetical protein
VYYLIRLLIAQTLQLYMQILSELQRYNSCSVWLEGLRSKSTKYVYSIHLSLFCKFHNVTPVRFITPVRMPSIGTKSDFSITERMTVERADRIDLRPPLVAPLYWW